MIRDGDIVDGGLYSRLTINGKPFNCLVDTGSTHGSFMRLSALTTLGLAHDRSTFKVQVFDGSTKPGLGWSPPTIVLNGKDHMEIISFAIVEHLHKADVIIGRAHAQTLGLVIENRLPNPFVEDPKAHAEYLSEALALAEIVDEKRPPAANDEDKATPEEIKRVEDALADLKHQNSLIEGFARVEPIKLEMKSRVPLNVKDLEATLNRARNSISFFSS